MSDNTLRVYVSVGDDGGGPFSLARGVVNGLIAMSKSNGFEPEFIVEGWTGPPARPGREKGLLEHIRSRRCHVTFINRDPLLFIERDKKTNWIDPEATKNNILKNFPKRFEYYLAQKTSIGDVQIVIAVCDPCALQKAREHKKPAICVTDHTWDVTFKKILEQVSMLDAETLVVLYFIGSLYAQADILYMWPEPITPPDFFEEAQELGIEVKRLEGVFESPQFQKNYVLEQMRIRPENKNLPLVCLSGGRLGPLGEIFEKIFDEYSQNLPEDYIVVINSRVRDTNGPVFQPGKEKVGSFNFEEMALIHQCVAYDLLITRGGGGSMNGAIAARCPIVNITEPLHPQVNAISQCARKMGIARLIPYHTLLARPRETIEHQLLMLAEKNKEAKNLLSSILQNSEIYLARELISRFA